MKNLWKKWIFIAQFHFQDPESEYGPGFRIRIRIQPGNLNPDTPGFGSATLVGRRMIKFVLWLDRYYWNCSTLAGCWLWGGMADGCEELTFGEIVRESSG